METIVSGFIKAAGLILSLDPELYSIILLSLKVSGGAVLVASLAGIPLGAACALRRFPGRRSLVLLLNTFMGFPPVVAGLLIYLLLSRSGPMGFIGLLYSPGAMVMAQTVIVSPIVAGLSWSAAASISPRIRETALTLGASGFAVDWRVISEARMQILSAVIAGFGRAIAEVGAVLIVGGNIAGYTRMMTTAIAMETGKGSFELAIALGIVLLLVAFLVNILLRLAQGGFGR